MGQQNTLPAKVIVPGVNSHPKALDVPEAARPQVTTTHSGVPCVFRVPSVPYANSRVEIVSESPSACSIQLPASRGLRFKNLYAYKNHKDQWVITSGDTKDLDEKLSKWRTQFPQSFPAPIANPSVPSRLTMPPPTAGTSVDASSRDSKEDNTESKDLLKLKQAPSGIGACGWISIIVFSIVSGLFGTVIYVA